MSASMVVQRSLSLIDLGGGRQSSVTSATAVGSNTNSKLQFFIIVGNEKFAGLVHPYFSRVLPPNQDMGIRERTRYRQTGERHDEDRD